MLIPRACVVLSWCTAAGQGYGCMPFLRECFQRMIPLWASKKTREAWRRTHPALRRTEPAPRPSRWERRAAAPTTAPPRCSDDASCTPDLTIFQSRDLSETIPTLTRTSPTPTPRTHCREAPRLEAPSERGGVTKLATPSSDGGPRGYCVSPWRRKQTESALR